MIYPEAATNLTLSAQGLVGFGAPTSAQCLNLVKLKASDPAGQDRFGRVALDDDLLVVGAPWHDDLGSKSGAAYVFDLRAGIELHHLTASDGASDDQFGVSVAVGGGRIVVGAPGHAGVGAAYVFDAATGQELFKLLGQAGSFGISCAITEAHIAVGAPYEGLGGTERGAAYVFDADTGLLIKKLVAASNPLDFDRFGYSVAVSGGTVIVGAPRKNRIGSAYAFDSDTGQQLLELVGLDTKQGDAFGASVDMLGARVIVGAPQERGLGDLLVAPGGGAAWLFTGTCAPRHLPHLRRQRVGGGLRSGVRGFHRGA